MNNLQVMGYKTPIEIALGIDENGMTTAKKLYTFLELSPSNYAKWCKANIVRNEFAEENVDYWAFVPNDEQNFNPNPTTDYKLTAHFSKKLSMKGSGEKAEQAREYFTTLEEKVKQKTIDLSQLSPELQMFNKIFQSVAQQQLEQKRQAKQIAKRMRDNGNTKTAIKEETRKIAVIYDKPQLKAIFESIVKRYAMNYCT